MVRLIVVSSSGVMGMDGRAVAVPWGIRYPNGDDCWFDAPAVTVVGFVGRLLSPSVTAPPPLILLLLFTLAGNENWSNCWRVNKKTELTTIITMVEIVDRPRLPLSLISIFYQRFV